MGIYILLFLIPLVAWLAIAKFLLHYEFTWGELALQFGVTSLIIVLVFFAGSYGQTHDVMFVNGHVVKTDARRKSCPSGWRSSRDSHCTEYRTRQVFSHQTCTTINKQRSCTNHYDTEYKYDYNWERRYFVFADYSPYADASYEIRRVDLQGVKIPPSFAALKINHPVTQQISFTNYIKAASSSLFAKEPPNEDTVVLAYPQIRNHFLANRVIVSGTKIDAAMWRQWNTQLMEVNTALQKTGANVLIVLTGNPPAFAEMLARAWEAHNLNDVVVVIGTKAGIVDWVDVTSWSKNSLVEIEIRDGILDLKTLDNVAINAIITDAVSNNFVLRKMDEFEYLADDTSPPTWVFILAAFILLLVTPIVTYYFNKYDVIG